MKKIGLFIILFSLLGFTNVSSAQSNFGKTFIYSSKYQKKNLKKFNKVKRHKSFIPFNRRSVVNHPSVTKKSRKILRRRFWENKFTHTDY